MITQASLRSGWYSPGLIFIGLVLIVSGCSDLTAKLSGTVYLDEKPLALAENQRGMIVFRPVAGGATCTGLVGADGEYGVATGKSEALVPGDYLVSVRVVELVQSEIEGQAPNGRPLTPAVYADPLTSGLTVTVQRGANNYDIKIDSSAGPLTLPAEPPSVAVGEEPDDGPQEEAGLQDEQESLTPQLENPEAPSE